MARSTLRSRPYPEPRKSVTTMISGLVYRMAIASSQRQSLGLKKIDLQTIYVNGYAKIAKQHIKQTKTRRSVYLDHMVLILMPRFAPDEWDLDNPKKLVDDLVESLSPDKVLYALECVKEYRRVFRERKARAAEQYCYDYIDTLTYRFDQDASIN
jgi:hypothetical protein